MSNIFEYIYNIGGNFSAKIAGMTEATGKFSANIEGSKNKLNQLVSNLAKISIGIDSLIGVAEGFNQLSQAGINFDSQMHDLSAITGVTGKGLDEIAGYARDSAKAFGTDAGTAVESYKLVLSQLSPEIAKNPAALKAMGESIQTTSKLMGNDATAAAEVLTTAMNQYGVSLKDPIAASGVMKDMMNVMAAAAQEGSAELPAIKEALANCGMAAKTANVGFVETNAAIQVLDKAGKKGAEGGVAIRNMLATMGEGEFMQRRAAKALAEYGISASALADPTKTFQQRLELLKPMINDTGAMTAVFGKENLNAAIALVQGTDEVGRYKNAIVGTRSAQEQAATIMNSYAERQARINQQIEDWKITMFQATGGASIWAGTLTSMLVPLGQVMPFFTTMASLMSNIKNLQWANMWTGVTAKLSLAKNAIILTSKATWGFLVNMGKSTLAVLKFTAVGIFNALRGLGALIISFITTGATSVTFAGIASTSFGIFATSASVACKAVTVAIASIPIIGWIAIAITALVAIGAYFWNTSVKFRAVLKGLWAGFKAFFTSIWDMAKSVFTNLGKLMLGALTFNPKMVFSALKGLTSGFSKAGGDFGKAFKTAYDAEMKTGEEKKKADAKAKANKKKATASDPLATLTATHVGSPIGKTLGKVSNGGGTSNNGNVTGGGAIRNITVSIGKLVEKLEVRTTTLAEGSERIKEQITEALLSAVNDVNLAV